MMVNISADAKPIKNIEMANSNTPIGKVSFAILRKNFLGGSGQRKVIQLHSGNVGIQGF